MNTRWILVLAGWAVVSAVAPAAAAAAEDRPRALRPWLQAGVSKDREDFRLNDEDGWAIAGGIDLGRTFALVIGLGFEQYPDPVAPRTIVMAGVGGPDTLRVEAVGGKTVFTLSCGGRLAIRGGRFEPYALAALGLAEVSEDHPRYVDPATGATVYPSSSNAWSGFLGEAGAGLRTHLGRRFDWLIDARWRVYTQGFEGDSGSSFQANAGVLLNL
jgi:hypothetical protein